MFKYKCITEYIGSPYFGWQIQNNGLTIQEIIQKAIGQLCGKQIEIFGSGRTDSGVHALGQCFHFEIEENIEKQSLLNSLNHFLKGTMICIIDCENLGQNSDFHARFCAKNREYIYRVLNRKCPSAILENRCWWIHKDIDIDKMKIACKQFIGKHDFSTFRSINL